MKKNGPTPRPLSERFWAKVDKSGECWLWTAGRHRDGYGKFEIAGSTIGAHRVAWELSHGPIPAGMFVCHSCDVKNCVRHLFLGTHQDNMDDRGTKGRHAVGSRCGLSKLTELDVRLIRATYALGGVSQTRLGALFGILQPNVSRIILRTLWAHVPPEATC